MAVCSSCAKLTVFLAALLPAIAYLLREQPVVRGFSPLLTPRSTWQYHPDEVPSQRGRTVLITGGNAGLGYSSAKILVRKGASVVLACRNSAKCLDAAARLQRVAGQGGSVSTLSLDLASLRSVRSAAQTFLREHDRLDALMLNAGVMACPYALSEDGIEMQFAVNHVGHHYLTQLLLPLIQRTATTAQTHIVSLSSSAAFRGSRLGLRLDFSQLNDRASYSASESYGQSKLANILFAQELAKRLRPAATLVSAVHPGAVVTELPRYIIGRFPMILQQVMLSSMKFLGGARVGVMWDSDTAALSQVFAMSAPKALKDPEKYHGKFIVPLARISTPPEAAENATLQAQLWEFTEALIAQKVAGIDGSYSEQGSTKLLRFAVTHMGCVTCEVDITNIIQEQPGVSSGSVDYYSGLANVQIDPGVFDVAKLRAALEYAGYGLEEDLALAETHLKKTQEQLAEEAATADAERLREEKAAAQEAEAADPDGDDWLD